jgi:antitoxin CcdA
MHLTQEVVSMPQPYDSNAPKRATNLSINSDLLAKARELNIDLSATLEQALASQLIRREQKRWLDENKQAIINYNEFVDGNGLFGDVFRSF